ncbi:MAG: CoA transferase subunit [Conexibacter sp.]|nr:CoA transferase subunit [Conexibacter sp.]
MTVVQDLDDAIGVIANGATVAVGGSLNAGQPMALVRALIRANVSDLTIVGGLTAGLGLDIVIAAGLARRLVCPYVGAEDLTPMPPAMRWAAEDGRLEIWESDEGVHLTSLRACAQRLPFGTWVGGVGTAVVANPLIEAAVDEPTGKAFLKVRPLEVDVALVWAEAADADGNILLWGPDLGDSLLRGAAAHRVVQVERIVSTETLGRTPDRVVPWQADVVVRAPFGTHPFAGSGLRVDETWIAEYVSEARGARRDGDPDRLARFLQTQILDCEDEDAYLARIGMGRLRSLMC